MTAPASEPTRPPPGLRARIDAAARRREMWMRNSAMGVLLVLLVGSIFIAPVVLPWEAGGRILSDLLVTLILIVGVLAVIEHRRVTVALVLVSLVVVALRWAAWTATLDVRPLYRELSTLAALVVLAVAVGINVFAPGRPLSDRVFGAIVLFLLFGVMWAFAYMALALADPAAFKGSFQRDLAVEDWLYFSFVTLTTVGYGDITPVAKIARSLATLEALVGQLYPAIIIARIVSSPQAPR